MHYIYSILSGGCDFPGIVGIFRCGALTAVLIGYSMESDGVCGEVIYIFGTWTGVLKSEWYWKVSKFVIEVLNEFEM